MAALACVILPLSYIIRRFSKLFAREGVAMKIHTNEEEMDYFYVLHSSDLAVMMSVEKKELK